MSNASSVIISYDPNTNEDTAILLVGHKSPKKAVEVINAFQGKEATELWNKLTVKE